MNTSEQSLPPPPDPPRRPVLGGLSLLSSLGGVKLPPRECKKEFVHHDPVVLEEAWTKSPTDRMREIDSYRLHSLLPSEREITAIPTSIERISISSLQHLLALCGGYAAVRFSTEDISSLQSFSDASERLFTALDASYKNLSGLQKKKKLPAPVIQTPPEPPAEPSSSDVTADPLPQVVISPEEEADIVAVTAFHVLADEYLIVFKSLQVFVRRKHEEILPRSADGEAADKVTQSDPDNLVGLPRPLWLETLLSKYTKHCALVQAWMHDHGDTVAVRETGPNMPLNLGAFCAMLSCCLSGDIRINSEEHAALFELLLASNDSVCHFSPFETDSDRILSNLRSQPQQYWALRLFNFMKKLSELKTAKKDEKQLYDFEQHSRIYQ